MYRYLLPFVLLLCHTSRAQQGTVATGSDAAGAGGSLSYSVGQVGYTSVQSSGGTAVQGVQQPYEYLVMAVSPESTSSLGVGVAPNPTSDGVQLTLTTVPEHAQRYALVDAAGHVLRTGVITGTTLHIPMADLPRATYVLHIDGPSTTTFRIIKQ